MEVQNEKLNKRQKQVPPLRSLEAQDKRDDKFDRDDEFVATRGRRCQVRLAFSAVPNLLGELFDFFGFLQHGQGQDGCRIRFIHFCL